MGALFYYAPKQQNISFTKKLFAESIPCNSKGIAPTRPSDVKALTQES